jgi:hypothetical protein
MRKVPGSAYDKWNISVVICDTDIPLRSIMACLPENLSSPPVISAVRVTRSLILYVCFVDRVCPFVLFLSAIVLSVLLRYTDASNLS